MMNTKLIYDNLNNGKLDNDKIYFEIIIPTYKREILLEKAINSALNQDYDEPFIISIIDDNPESNNDTEKMIKEKFYGRVRYFKNIINQGMFGNWNVGVDVSIGQYIVLLHDDDELKENFLKTIHKVILKVNDFGVISSKPRDIDVFGNFLNESYINILKKRISRTFFKNKIIKIRPNRFFLFNPQNICGIVFNKTELGNDLFWEKDEFPSADYYLNFRLSKKLKSYKLPDHIEISLYRWHKNESTNPDVIKKTLVSDYRFLNKIYENQTYLLRKTYIFILNTIYKFKLNTIKNPNIKKDVAAILELNLEKTFFSRKLFWMTINLYNFILDVKNAKKLED